MDRIPVICNFTGVYERQDISDKMDILDFTELNGCGMYIDTHAEAVILSLISRFAPEGIHFIDNGNYHYMSRLFCSFIAEPFELIVFDHHTDDQQPMIEGLKSCGSWIADIKDENVFLNSVELIQEYKNIPAKKKDLPVYISIDKDVLSTSVLATNWDQGNMTAEQFFEIFDEILLRNRIIGIDICGEPEPYDDISLSAEFNKNILSHIFSCCR